MGRIDIKLLALGFAGVLLLAGGSATVAATDATAAGPAPTDTIDFGDHHIVVQDATVHIADAHITGPGLPDKSIEEGAYTVDDATVSTDGFDVTINGQDVRVGHLTVTLDNVGVTLENVSIGESNTS